MNIAARSEFYQNETCAMVQEVQCINGKLFRAAVDCASCESRIFVRFIRACSWFLPEIP